ncbi:hypothetical protein [Mesorhizobium sp. M0802]|uniref:hypothetical protein n=1 Tax=Mesorhizobium sp. M0802 TaxID=2957001 RepID=UPI003338AE08
MTNIENATSPRLPKPESLEAKFKLLTSLPYDKRATRKHSLVFGFILDWYHSKYGNALASVRHVVATIKERDPSGKGLYAGDVHGALTDLVSWGYLHQEKGSGRRASRYVPVWDLVCSVQKSPNANHSVLNSPNADVRESPNATINSVRVSMNEDPSTLTRSLDPGTGKDEHDDCTAPLAPPLAGLSAAAAGPAQAFEKLYRAYGVRKNKAVAEAEFKKLDLPIADLVASANVWKAAAGDDVTRMYLDRWLREGRFDEDPPTKYEPKKPDKVKMPRKAAGATRRDVEIEEILWDGRFGPIDVLLRWLDREGDEPASSTIRLHGDDYATMKSELAVINDSDFEFRRALLDLHTAKDGTETYRWHRYPDAANDNLVREGDSDDESCGRHLPWQDAA